MNDVVEHRPPLKRVQIGSSISVVRGEVTEALSGVSPVEQDRIWAITKQVAEGCNAPTAPVSSADSDFVYSPYEHLSTAEYLGGVSNG